MRALPSAVALAGVLGPLLCGCGARDPVHPNLVLITVDALRADRLECYGGQRDLGVEACGVGETGARYVWAFSTASSGAPAAASLLTSLYPWQHGVRRSAATFLPHDSRALAETLRRGGYATAAFVTSPEINRSRNFQQGFDRFDDRASSPSTPDSTSPGEVALAWAADAPRPWFLWVHYAEPHGPFEDAEAGAGTAQAPGYDELYERAIRRLDRRLSQLIAVLDSQPAPPGVLLVALHGQALNGLDGRTGHGRSLGLEQLRVPLLWRPPRAGPGRGVGRRVVTPVSIVDVAPTLLRAAGIAPPESFAGEALPYGDPAPGRPGEPERSLFAENADEVAMIRGGEYCALGRGAGDGATGALSARRSARLWPPGDRSRERLPEYDGAATSRERLSRLEPELAAWARSRVPLDSEFTGARSRVW